MEHQLGLALSGGGVKGAAHIGVLKALQEYKINPTCISGTSAGAIVGSFYAAGCEPEEILDIFRNSSLFSLSHIAFGKPGIIDLDKFADYFKKHLAVDDFSSLDKELFIVATDLIKGKMKVFDSGSLIAAMLSSSAFPVVFSPYKEGGNIYVDGGIVNNFPVELLAERCKYLLGVYLSPLKKITAANLTKSWEVLERAYSVANRYSSLQKLDSCNWVIHPQELERYDTFDMNKTDEIFELGYQSAKMKMPVILEDLGM